MWIKKVFLALTVIFTYRITIAHLPIHITSLKNIPQTTNTELPLVVLICSYNNAQWVIQNLDSVRTQNYINWRIIYIDDASSDSTAQLVADYLDTHDLWDKCTLITQKTRYRKLKNLYTAFHHYIEDNEIIVQLDGDDWLAHDQVFSLINNVYQHNNVWLTYGNYQNYPKDSSTGQPMHMIPSKIVINNTFRKTNCYMHLRTFYGWLAKHIKLHDLLTLHVPDFKSKFFPAANDAAIMWPMLEMAGVHFSFINKILYQLNRSNPINGFKVDRSLQTIGGTELQQKIPVYQPLKAAVTNRYDQFKNAQAACLILSDNNPEGAQQLITSLKDYANNITNITLLYAASSSMKDKYHALAIKYPNLHVLNTTNQSTSHLLNDWLAHCSTQHTLIAHDGVYITESIDIGYCIQELERTGAYGFYFGINHESDIPDQHIWHNIYASTFWAAEHAWCNNLDITLLRTEDIKHHLARLPESFTLKEFKSAWEQNIACSLKQVGLFFTNRPVAGQLRTITTLLPSTPPLQKIRRILKGRMRRHEGRSYTKKRRRSK